MSKKGTWDKVELQKLIDEGKTLDEIGKLRGVSRQRVQQMTKLYQIEVKKETICPLCNNKGFIEKNAGLLMVTCKCKLGESKGAKIRNANERI